nr:MAG TPA: hypothetical protein [Bacteriophage sp.]
MFCAYHCIGEAQVKKRSIYQNPAKYIKNAEYSPLSIFVS